MTREHLENVAKAFFNVEHDNEWHDASVSVRNDYVHLAQTALLLMSEAAAEVRSCHKRKALARIELASHISKNIRLKIIRVACPLIPSPLSMHPHHNS